MDRNQVAVHFVGLSAVALRKESVDRNDIRIAAIDSISNVALRKESVDRNITVLAVLLMYNWSLSARRAWIEIKSNHEKQMYPDVALRKESVDRNGVGS